MTIAKRPDFKDIISLEMKKFEEHYRWMEAHLPPSFFKEVDSEVLSRVAHVLMGLDLQGYFSEIQFKDKAIVLSLETPLAAIEVLQLYRSRTITHYRTFISNAPPLFPPLKSLLRVTLIHFTQSLQAPCEMPYKEEIFSTLKNRFPHLTPEQFHQLCSDIDPRFLLSLPKERLSLAMEMVLKAKEEDFCQYEIIKNKESPHLQIVLAWKNVPTQDFVYHLAKVVQRHGLFLKYLTLTHIQPHAPGSILVLSMGLDGSVQSWDDFLQELEAVKFFPGQEGIDQTFVDTGLVSGKFGNLLKIMTHFIHQALLHADPNLYSFHNIEEGLCRHPKLTAILPKAFDAKFHPQNHNVANYETLKEEFLSLVSSLDTGDALTDLRRKNILKQALSFVEFCLKTNFYENYKTGFSFRFDPRYLENLPYDRHEKFPELPFAIFFMKGLYYAGFHIRFRDLSRGGLRTVYPDRLEQLQTERNNLFAECYNLAYTQQKKNKDIPEGGAKGVILIEPYERLKNEELIYAKTLEAQQTPPTEIEEKLALFKKEQKQEYLYQSQRSYITNFLTLINCEPSGALKNKNIIDYYQKPEYVYIGPDENMHDSMILWIAALSKKVGYKPGSAFMSSKPGAGINHKEFGVTSCGVNVYMEEVLRYLDIDPETTPFTIKMTGGPDGDVAGNQMYNLFRFYPKTAKLLSTIDISGTIFDPEGLDLSIIATLFKEGKPLSFYPPEKLHEGGFLLDVKKKRKESAYVQQTLCLHKKEGKLLEKWVSGSEMNHLLRVTVHQTKADIFIPGGGRPRTLNERNYQEFLDETGKPTSKAIVEGANLYLSPEARKELEKRGVLIIKDSSANKGGVICSSFEVLSSLVLSEEEFLKEKPCLVEEILEVIRQRARDEARLLLQSKEEGNRLCELSDAISVQINKYTDEIMGYLSSATLSLKPEDPLTTCLLNFSLPLLREKYSNRLLHDVPDSHKKAIIACFLAQRVVYRRGLTWEPSVVDILPLIIKDHTLFDS